MNREEYIEHLKKEIQIGLCWVVVLCGMLGLCVTALVKYPTQSLTWVIVAATAAVTLASFIDDRTRGKRNKKIRDEHKHLRKQT